MKQNRQSAERRRSVSKSRRSGSSEGNSATIEPHPIQQLQAQVGNAQIARMLADPSESDSPAPEVGLAGGPVSNRLAARIYASVSGGHPLARGVQRSLEATYGRQLDHVRIHDDPEADALSQSVSANAFTLGSDIFLSRQASAQDEHLLEHEVAHVLQQESMATGGPLTVGAATDPLEREAETATGQAPPLSGKTGNAQQAHASVQRDVGDELREAADTEEEALREQMQLQPPPIMEVNNVTDANAARRLIGIIEGHRTSMQEGGRTGTIDGNKISANETAIAKLSDYLVTVGEQGRTLGTFQEQAQQVILDFGRVSGQMLELEAMGVVTPGETAQFRAEELVGAATGAMSAEESAAGMQGDAVVIRAQAQEAHDTLKTKSNEFSQAQRSASRAVHGLNSALNNLNAGIIPREEDPELAAQQRAIKAKVSTMQSRLATGLQVVSAIGGAAGVGTAATTAATSALGEGLTGLGQQALGALSPETIATAISEEWYREETNQVESQIAQANAQSREAAITANVSQVREAQTALFSAMQMLEEKLSEYLQARDTLRMTLRTLGTTADRESGGQTHYAVIAELLGDVDVLAVQIGTTLSLGLTEEEAAGRATEARATVEGARNEETGEREGGLTYYEPYQDFQLGGWGRTGGLVYRASPQRIYFVTSERTPGSAYGGRGAANPQVRTTMEQLEEMRQTVQGMRGVLSASLGLAMQR